MKIGFANIYSFRPHVEHLYYLSDLVRRAGHETFFLTCDAAVSNCYARSLKGTSKFVECPKCVLGGIRSYSVRRVCSIATTKTVALSTGDLGRLSLSSSSTLTRIEADCELNEPEVIKVAHSLHRPIDQAFQSALRWIETNALEAVVCFNGRMDIPRAVTFACETLGIPYVTHERTWFGHGIQLVPNGDCLSLSSISELSQEFKSKPLTESQAKQAGKLAADRFLQRNHLEWRVYNENPEVTEWPLPTTGRRVLVLPSSKNEFAGHADWKAGWEDNTSALDDFLDVFSIDPQQVVLRCHPNWAEDIGRVSGGRSLSLYRDWAERKRIHCILSEEKANTYDLIQQADIVVLNGGSSAVEAGVCGKQIVCLGPATYASAGFVQVANNRDELLRLSSRSPIDPEDVIRKTLRFIYLCDRRYPQFVDFVRALRTTSYKYYDGADANRLLNLLNTGKVMADDDSFSEDGDAESEVIHLLQSKKWALLSDYELPQTDLEPLEIRRRVGLRWVDSLRAKFSLGDRG